MSDHHLKTHPGPFGDVWIGRKPFEFRKNDRAYALGDRLFLQEWTPRESHDESTLGEGGYSGRTIEAIVTYILPGGAFGVPEDHCVMAIEILARRCAW